jgi:hypothetical protein
VALFRRTPSDPEVARARDGFRRVAAELDAAQRALLTAVPTARDEGAPLGDAIAEFLAGLARADALMPSWRIPATETVWLRCAEAIGLARDEAGALRSSGTTLGFEALNARLGDVISPLEELAGAAQLVRRLR